MSDFINVGSLPNDGTGDQLRAAFIKVNEFFSTYTSILGTLQTRVEALENDTSEYAPVNHTHSEYALAGHSHSEYALTSHTHAGYAALNHSHGEYALASHTHNQYVAIGTDGKLTATVLPQATETAMGAVQRATEALALAGTNAVTYMTPLLTKRAIEAAPTPPFQGVTARASSVTGPTVTLNGSRLRYFYEASSPFTFRFVSTAPSDEVVTFQVLIRQSSTGGFRGSFPDLAGWLNGVPAVSVPSGQSATITSPYLDREAGRKGVLHVTRKVVSSSGDTAWFAAWARIDG